MASLRSAAKAGTHVGSWRSKSGERITFECQGTLLRSGHTVLFMRFIGNETEYETLHKRGANDAYKNLDRSSLDIWVHDVRTPIHGLINLFDEFKTAHASNSPSRGSHMEELVADMDICVRNLLDLACAKLAIKKNVEEKTFVAFKKELSNTRAYLLLSRKAGRLECDFRSIPNAEVLHVEYVSVFQIIQNLVTNAWAATPNTLVRVRVEYKKESGSTGLTIVVKDDGKGLPPRAVDFLKGKSNDKPSSGMGLRIVRDCSRKLGGGGIEYRFDGGAEIIVKVYLSYFRMLEDGESPLGSASRQTIRQRPVRSSKKRMATTEDKPRPKRAKLPLTPEGQSLAPSFPRARILAADDQIVNRKLISRFVEKHCELLNVFERVSQVIEERKRDPSFNVVLLDIGMPEGCMDGIEATRILRRQGFEGIILALTGHTRADLLQEMRLAGVDGVISKPFSKADLHRYLNAASSCGFKSIAKATSISTTKPEKFDSSGQCP